MGTRTQPQRGGTQIQNRFDPPIPDVCRDHVHPKIEKLRPMIATTVIGRGHVSCVVVHIRKELCECACHAGCSLRAMSGVPSKLCQLLTRLPDNLFDVIGSAKASRSASLAVREELNLRIIW